MRQPVLAGVDGSQGSLAAAHWAAQEAELRGVRLHLVHASPPLPGGVPVSAVDTLRGVGERLLERVIADLRERYPGIDVRGEQVDGAPAAALLAASRGAGLLVARTRGSGGFDGLTVGSVALRVAAAAACPVVLVPARPAGAYENGPSAGNGAGRVVLGFDAHRPADEAADFAFSAAEARGAVLHVVQAWALPAESVSPRTLFVVEEDRATWEDQEVFRLSDALRGRRSIPGWRSAAMSSCFTPRRQW
ncbi:universal stress protein [Streptomyces sp. NPDC020298]|uniref:universal stress protein n=1 Tax=unclassified Streptomyces TaxID=2593676 RepID=UPI0033C99D71